MSAALFRRWLTRAAAAALACLALFAPAAQAQQGDLAAAVKATFLYRFASFVSWPPTAFSAPDAPLVICVVATPDFISLTAAAAQGQNVAGRPIRIQRLGQDGLRDCHILFVGANPEATAQALRAARGEPILTVTDEASGMRAHGMIHFVMLDHRVRFHIDDASASQCGLTISSRLLDLAVSVRRRQQP
ncbi:MAG TPA: YfiR family protein [Caulobacterales bacterium]|nr:YfiR family protein [Caulobacterales bacterium]